MNALIGSTGLIGKKLLLANVDKQFNSSNINEIANCTFDIVYCAAPSGNRLYANQHPHIDSASVDQLISYLSTVTATTFILISTVDTLYAPNSVYGSNRKKLENFVKHRFPTAHIIRLCTLIDKEITKNVLYDLTNDAYISSINVDHIVQWYPLDRLSNDINTIIKNNIAEINLVSEPIRNKDIIDAFFAHYNDQLAPGQQTTPYNITCNHSELFGNPGNYTLTKESVFNAIKNYLL